VIWKLLETEEEIEMTKAALDKIKRAIGRSFCDTFYDHERGWCS